MNSIKVDEVYLNRLLDDLQQDHTTLYNTMKNPPKKDQLPKLERQAKLVSDLMNKCVSLKNHINKK